TGALLAVRLLQLEYVRDAGGPDRQYVERFEHRHYRQPAELRELAADDGRLARLDRAAPGGAEPGAGARSADAELQLAAERLQLQHRSDSDQQRREDQQPLEQYRESER